MKSTTVVLTTLLASLAVAQPQHRHLHAVRHQKEKRDQTVVWVTDVVYETETVDVTTTIWVTPGFVPPTTTTEASAAASSTSLSDGQFLESQTASPLVQAPETTSSSVYIPPTPSSTYVNPSSSEAAPAYIPPAETPTSVNTPAYVAPVESSAPAAQPTTAVEPVETPPTTTVQVAPTTTTAAAPVATTAASSGSYSGVCSSGSPCSGDITWYDVGLGACGETNVSTDHVVALPYELMGTASNNNPYCGKTITVSYGGSSIVATVVDKCMGCQGYAIDLSSSAFASLDSLDAGRVLASWYFNE